MEHVVTLIADRESAPLPPDAVSRVRDAVGGGAPVALSAGEAVDIPCPSLPDEALLRAALAGAAVDAIAQKAAGRRKRLLAADMDGTILRNEILDDLAARAGVGERVAAITWRSINGEIDFADALRERVALLEGLGLEALDATLRLAVLMPGAAELVATMRAHGAYAVLISGGFTFFTERIARWAGFDAHRANLLLDDGARLTGRMGEPILDREGKRDAMLRVAAERGIGVGETLAIGDGANDVAMLRAAGLGIAFHARPVVAASTQARIEHAWLRGALFAQGYRGDEIVTPPAVPLM